MKQVWLGLVFLFLYGVFSIKTQAAEMEWTQRTKAAGGASAGLFCWSI